MSTKKQKAKAKRVPTIARGKRAKAAVFRGTKTKTSGGLTKDKLKKNRRGRIVSKAASAAGAKRYENIRAWNEAFMKARTALGCKGFVLCKKGSALYAKTKAIYVKCVPKIAKGK